MKGALWSVILLAAMLAASAVWADAVLLGRAEWLPDDPRFFGITGIDTRDGVNVTFLTGRALVVSARIRRSHAGGVEGIEARGSGVLRDPQGLPLNAPWNHAGDLARGPDGRIHVAFEEHNRVWSYRTLDAPATALPEHVDFGRLPIARGLAALAVDRSGTLHAIPERPARMTHGFPSYSFRDGEWIGSFRIPSEGNFLPVGADFGPDGRLYLLEREVDADARAQLRRFPMAGLRLGRGEVVWQSEPGQFDRLEAIGMWRDNFGRMRATMVSNTAAATGRPMELVELLVR